ncbi:MAG TPA: arginine--tRNA ligase [Flavobacteriales bacterium]|nr:arginine--tRNA ligase [Flavobacteriales bacterium]HRN35961.1 arginine--tRNA ligase [Flavobacteriales bacterium]HRO39989.1 arginine--tRNA ligase [Flavobacteriales bacterium]HRP81320.1 arginine--tRNA ligase [Flavobacteriales bacterium]HRQ84325.1 arginine--tRNA ligase [Flavobacteriales bacterium]
MFQDRLQAQLLPVVLSAFKELFGPIPEAVKIAFQPTRPEFEGDLTINVFPFLKLSGQGPQQTATAIGEYLVRHALPVERFNVVKGFLNMVISDAYWTGFLKEAGERDILQFGPTGNKVMVEYASPNTNKPLHLGHLRNIFLGYSVSRMLQAAGHEVVKVQVINDRGIHICKSMVAWRMFGNGETPASSGLKGDKLVGKYYVAFDKVYKEEVAGLMAAGKSGPEAEKQAPILLEAQAMLRQWEANDPQVRALWEKMNGWVYEGFNATYARAGVDFDKNYYESNTYLLGKEDVLKGLAKGVFFRKDDGSVWVDNTAEGLDEKVLLRADGTSLYITQDIGTAIKRFEEFPGLSRMIYTVGNEQDYHFKVLFIILKKLGFAWADGLFHLSYGMVDLPSGKMKSREGTVVDADDLIDEMVAEARATGEQLSKLDDFSGEERNTLFEMIGLAALKYFLLKVDPKKRMLFDPKASIDLQGHTGPFIQYTYARIRSLLRKAGLPVGGGRPSGPAAMGSQQLLPEEKNVIKLLHQFPAVLNESATKLEPSALANHAYELVKAYNAFYQTVPVLKEGDAEIRGLRLALSSAVAETTRKAMWCLGIEVPERM